MNNDSRFLFPKWKEPPLLTAASAEASPDDEASGLEALRDLEAYQRQLVTALGVPPEMLGGEDALPRCRVEEWVALWRRGR